MARSLIKGFYFPSFFFRKEFTTKFYSRNGRIPGSFIDRTIEIHTGNRFRVVTLTKETLHHRLGELTLTRAFYVPKKKKKRS